MHIGGVTSTRHRNEAHRSSSLDAHQQGRLITTLHASTPRSQTRSTAPCSRRTPAASFAHAVEDGASPIGALSITSSGQFGREAWLREDAISTTATTSVRRIHR